MAKRYGGTFSPERADSQTPPDTKAAYRGARPRKAGARSNIMFVPPVVLAVTSVMSGAVSMVTGLVAAAFLLLGAWLLREGLTGEAAYDARRVAKRPAIPRKIFGAVFTGIGIAGAAWRNDPSILAAVLYGGSATVLQLAAFGFDPLRDKQLTGVDSFQQDRVARVVTEAEAHLAQITQAVARVDDRRIQARLERFTDQVRDIIRTVEEDPRDLSAARKFLGVYLNGAKEAALKFADVQERSGDPAAKHAFEALLGDLEASFGRKLEQLLLDNAQDLNIEIDVLRERLQREGLRLD